MLCEYSVKLVTEDMYICSHLFFTVQFHNISFAHCMYQSSQHENVMESALLMNTITFIKTLSFYMISYYRILLVIVFLMYCAAGVLFVKHTYNRTSFCLVSSNTYFNIRTVGIIIDTLSNLYILYY